MTRNPTNLHVAIAVVTRQRQRSLARMLEGLARVRQPHGCDVTIVIVDNDPAGSSRAVVEQATAGSRWPIEYHLEPTPGIPFARNAVVAVCYRRTDAIIFIDDDEVPEVDWLEHLVAARAKHSADVVTGPAVPRFDSAPPGWVMDGGFFDLPRYPSGTARDAAFTNNVLVNSSVFASFRPWFDERLQFTGGSDTHFFRRLHLSGYRIVWCDEAVVHDCIPPARVTVGWLIQRAYRYGHTHAFVRVDLKQSTRAGIVRAALGKLRFAGGSLVRGIIGRRPSRMVDAARETAYLAGMLANVFGSRYAEYQIKGAS